MKVSCFNHNFGITEEQAEDFKLPYSQGLRLLRIDDLVRYRFPVTENSDWICWVHPLAFYDILKQLGKPHQHKIEKVISIDGIKFVQTFNVSRTFLFDKSCDMTDIQTIYLVG